MSRLNRFDRQNPMDFMVTAQGSINGLFDFLKNNEVNYNNRDFYLRKNWDVKQTIRLNTSTISASQDIENGGSFLKQSQNVVNANVNYNYGNLYNWYTISGGTLAPTGWHVPINSEWDLLVSNLGGASIAGGKLKSTRATTDGDPVGWNIPNDYATNEVGFEAFGGGYRLNNLGTFMGNIGFWWTSTQYSYDITNSYNKTMFFNYANVGTDFNPKANGFSIRLIRDNTTGYVAGETVTDIDGNIYGTTLIDNQVWMTQNLKVTKYNDGTPIPNITGSTEWSALTTGAYCTYNNSGLTTYEDPTFYYTTEVTTYTKGFSKSYDIKND